jgi:predicted nuclease of predicted toxin-antitoxin system
MQIYLDDCSDDNDLVRGLSQSGHTVYTPRGEGTRGARDPVHLEYASTRGYALLTRNPSDFRDLHNEWQATGRTHSGILIVCLDNIRGKDMRPPDIVRAIGKLLSAGLSITNEIHILNQWR